jgi:hypothetical protein
MTARAVTLAGWVVLAVAATAVELRARARPSRLVTLGTAVALALRIRFVRFATLAAWLWLGWHLFVR